MFNRKTGVYYKPESRCRRSEHKPSRCRGHPGAGETLLLTAIPRLIRIELNGVPMTFQSVHARDLARYPVELPGLPTGGRGGKLVFRIVNQEHGSIHSGHPPSIPFDVLELPIVRVRLRQNLALIIARPDPPPRCRTNRGWMF